MKIGAHFWVWEPAVSVENARLIEKISKMGFDAVELPILDTAFPIEYVKQHLTTTNLNVAVTAGCFPHTNPLSVDQSVKINALRYLEYVVDTASKLGSEVVAGPIYAAVSDLRFLTPEEKMGLIASAAETLKPIVRKAKDLGVKLALEPLNRYDITLINTASDGLNLVNKIGEENVGLLLDTFHMNIEERSLGEAIRSAGKRLYHLHASESHRGAPGTGTVNWREVADAVKSIGYNQMCVIESFTPKDQGFAAAMRMWFPKSASQDQLAEAGLLFLRRIFA
ncbi:MAG: sugar phosphate isomerase/epimerase family protein [Nitrososphaerales archaeon]